MEQGFRDIMPTFFLTVDFQFEGFSCISGTSVVRHEKKNLKRVMVRDGICVLNSFHVVFYPVLAPIPNFIQKKKSEEKHRS